MASKSLTFDIYGRDRSAASAISNVGRSAHNLTKVFAAVGAAIAAAFAVTRIVNFARTTVTEFAEAQAAQTKLSDAFERFPALANANIQAFRDLNTELAKKTRFDDDALATGQATLAQYGLTEDQLLRLTPLLADYAAKTGKDVTDAATDLGKALLGSGRALKLIGVDFKDTGSVAGNFEEIMASLSAQVGGFAEKDGKTLAGQLLILKNAFGEVKESVGSIFAPAVGLLANVINDKLLPVLAIIVDKYGPQIEQFFTSAASAAGNFLDGLAASLANGDINSALPTIAVAFAALGEVLMQDGVLDALKTMAVEVLPPLVDLLVALAPAIPPIAQVLTAVLVPALQLAGAYVSGLTALLSGNKTEQQGWLRSLITIPGFLGDAFRSFAETEISIINAVVDGFNTLAAAYKNLVAVFGVRISVPQLPHATLATVTGAPKKVGKHAEGGYFDAKPGGYLGILGEGKFDEVGLPLSPETYARIGAGIAAAGGGSAAPVVNVTVNAGAVADKNKLAQELQKIVQDAMKRGAIPRTAFA